MLTTYLTALAGMVVISCCWLAVQRLWQRQFPDHGGADNDALAGRSGCQGCDCKPSPTSPPQSSSQQAREAH